MFSFGDLVFCRFSDFINRKCEVFIYCLSVDVFLEGESVGGVGRWVRSGLKGIYKEVGERNSFWGKCE